MGELNSLEKIQYELTDKDGNIIKGSFNTEFIPMEVEPKENAIGLNVDLKPMEFTVKVKPVKIRKILSDHKHDKMMKKVKKLIKVIQKLGYGATIKIEGDNNGK